MTFFERELRKIVGADHPDATYVGRACYVDLSDMNKAKIQFVSCRSADHYDAIQLDILNRNDGKVDSLRLRFAEIWGKGQNDNFYIQQKGPHAWTDNGKTEWYAYIPTQADFKKLSGKVNEYLDVFRPFDARKISRPSLDAQIRNAENRSSVLPKQEEPGRSAERF